MITRALWLLVVGLIVTIGPARAESNGVAPQLFMPDGQLKSHSVRVYISRDLAPNQQPRLRLLRSHAVTKRDVDEAARLEPGIVASGQVWTGTCRLPRPRSRVGRWPWALSYWATAWCGSRSRRFPRQ